ncbi:MAG: preprotein translocase subunit SecG [Mycoplasmataceae bacterium]|nr:preprotein translocase subunit SecG [Mycoplasmataceae bacterium]MBR2849191.1 preprotein translocase subunit SecG [Mycoplasmataceae bacterium]MBR4025342.1 preprotein translocase subunit SecG [Mycoplasmataceae bacterium]
MEINIVVSILFIISFLIIIVGFLMAPDSNSFSGAIVGSSDLRLFSQTKEQGWKKFLKWTMIILGIIMFIVTILIRIFI